MVVTNKFQRGETVPIYAEHKDWDNEYQDPSTSIKVTVTNPKAVVKVTAEAMEKLEKGKYVYYYNSAADDETEDWKYVVISIDGSGDSARTTETHGAFILR